MNEKFDIFKKLPDGQPMWVRAVEGLTEAKEILTQLAKTAPANIFSTTPPAAKSSHSPKFTPWNRSTLHKRKTGVGAGILSVQRRNCQCT